MTTPVATLIGDLVASRRSSNRRDLHTSLRAALAETDRIRPGLRPLWITAGDEFQGVYPALGEALDAALQIRLRLHPVPVRFGLGWGSVTTLDDGELERSDAGVQDGPGWWAARAAIEAVAADEGRAATRLSRTHYRRAAADDTDRGSAGATAASGAGFTGPEPDAVNAALLCRDHLLGSADDRDIAILKGLLVGMTQSDLADAEGISRSAVSQRVRRSGLGMVLRSHELLRNLR